MTITIPKLNHVAPVKTFYLYDQHRITHLKSASGKKKNRNPNINCWTMIGHELFIMKAWHATYTSTALNHTTFSFYLVTLNSTSCTGTEVWMHIMSCISKCKHYSEVYCISHTSPTTLCTLPQLIMILNSMSIHPLSMLLITGHIETVDCGRKPEYLGKTHAGMRRTCQLRTEGP